MSSISLELLPSFHKNTPLVVIWQAKEGLHPQLKYFELFNYLLRGALNRNISSSLHPAYFFVPHYEHTLLVICTTSAELLPPGATQLLGGNAQVLHYFE